MNVRSSMEWLVEKLLAITCLVTGAWTAAVLIMDVSGGHFRYPLTFISMVIVAAALCTIGIGLMEGKHA